MTLEASLLVLIGGFLGGVFRFALSGFVGRRVGETFPFGTLAVNVTGAFAIGALAGAARAIGGLFAGEAFHAFAVVGVLGGYTTVSSFALQTLTLAEGGEGRSAVFNVVASALLCVIAVAAGYAAVLRLAG